MSKKIKSIFSIALTVCMLFSMAAFNVSAASVARTATITPSVTEAEAGDTVIVNVFLSNTVNLTSIGYRLTYNPDVFEVAAGTNGDYGIPNYIDTNFFEYYDGLSSLKKFGGFLTIGGDTAGEISVGGARDNGIVAAQNLDNFQMGGFVLMVKADAPAGDTTFSLIDAITSDSGDEVGANMIFTDVTFTVTGAAPTVDKSELVADIAEATTLLNSKTAGDAEGQVPEDDWNLFDAAIDAAQDVVDNEAATQGDVDNAVTALADATDAFNAAVVPSTDPTIAIESGTVAQGRTITLKVTVSNIPANTQGVAAGIAYDST
ncbi:MAG: hypothetical protein GX800_02100, partial [Clostridiaceae bacterium]|nr:hypothetical protein [Clostridiaceae bacterium]